MASSRRPHDRTRERLAAQAAARAAARERARRRRTVIGAVIAVVAVLAGSAAIAIAAAGSSGKPAAKPSASATPDLGPDCRYTAVKQPGSKYVGLPPAGRVDNRTPYTAAVVTNRGQVVIALSTAKAPCTVNSFRFLAQHKFFDGTACHRLTSSVLQCGDPGGTGNGGPGYQFADENLSGATYPAGTVAMANAGPNTNGSQFFLVYQDTQLPASYTPFGRITGGLDVLRAIAKGGSTPPGDGKPNLATTITRLTVAAS